MIKQIGPFKTYKKQFLRHCNLSDSEKEAIYNNVLSLIDIWNENIKTLEKQLRNKEASLTFQYSDITAYIFYVIHDMILSDYSLNEIAEELKEAQRIHIKEKRNYSLNFSLACQRIYARSKKYGNLYKLYFKGLKRVASKSKLFNECLHEAFNDYLIKLQRAGAIDEHLKINTIKPTLVKIIVTTSFY